MVLQRTCKSARSPQFLIDFPLVRNQNGWSLHQIVLKNPSRSSYTTPPATYPSLWRTRAQGSHLHRLRNNWGRVELGFIQTSSPFLQTFVRWSLLQTRTCTLPCTPVRQTPL